MSDPALTERMRRLAERLLALPEALRTALERLVVRFQRPTIERSKDYESIFPKGFVEQFGVDLCLHHCFSNEPFTKDKFEYSVVRIINACGGRAEKARKGNRGHDVTISGIKVSLKTEAAQSIAEKEIHISKFMELGKGEWGREEAHLREKRDQFLNHLTGYDRIFTLRCLTPGDGATWKYELVEIPKKLLARAENGEFEVMHGTKQTAAIPGYCRVYDSKRNKLFELYFDGGSERKLQIRHLQKSGNCPVVATWEFPRET